MTKSKSIPSPERLVDLGNGLALWKIHLSFLKEQDKNARVMSPEVFNRLSENIKKDGQLTSLPLVLKKEVKGNIFFDIISGHHRTRAARKAGVFILFCIVIEKNISRSEVIAKQLSHNSLEGKDDLQTLKELYNEIKTIDFKIETGLTDFELENKMDNIKIDNIEIELDYEIINILFLPRQVKHFEKVILGLRDEASVYIADKKDFEKFAKLARKIAERDNIVNVAAIFARMLEIVDNELKENLKAKK